MVAHLFSPVESLGIARCKASIEGRPRRLWQGVAEEQAIEPVAEAVVLHRRQTQRAPMLAVDTPADARSLDPAVDRLELGAADSEPARDDRHLQ